MPQKSTKKAAAQTFHSTSPDQTKRIAKRVAKMCETRFHTSNKGRVLALSGELGSGKTTFVQGFAEALGVKENVLSPTFVLVREYQIPPRALYHIDCYRLEDPQELLGLGWETIIADPNNIVLVEWADRAQEILPSGVLRLSFSHANRGEREIVVE